ncbi:MAG: CNNM domain-containing protein, partial [Lachnospiraceae bacterium]|nr:CNNM domain-containing protein [Lachnospiraceae bacterium]
MSSALILRFIIMLILLAMSAFFSGSETALTTVSQIKMKTMAKEGDGRAKRVLAVLEKKDKMLSAILIGNNIVNLSASSLATTIATKLLGSVGAGIATGILTFLILIFGEITPKNRAQANNVNLSLRYAGIIWYLMTILTPLIFVINHISGAILRLIDGNNSGDDQKMTEEELRTIVDESKEEGVILTNEQKYIHNLFDFSDATAKEVMIPRIDVTMVNVNWSYDKLMDLIREEMLTRMPVYEG